MCSDAHSRQSAAATAIIFPQDQERRVKWQLITKVRSD